MLEKVLKNSNLGTKSQIAHLLNLLADGDLPKVDLRQLCLDYDYESSFSFEGMLSLLEWLGIIRAGDNIQLRTSINAAEIAQFICAALFERLAGEAALQYLFSHAAMSYSRKLNMLFIRGQFIPLRFAPIRNLLIELNFLASNKLIPSQFYITSEYLDWFLQDVIGMIEESTVRGISPAELAELQSKQSEQGLTAEEFVLGYERRMRKNHPKSDNITIISSLSASAGYDIKSYLSDDSIVLDKFIEVKSYSAEQKFYWSKNEIEVAKRERDNYFLYLVDINQIKDVGYMPMIFQNPSISILQNSDWKSACQNWEFKKG